jgi:hypothetical protein
MAVNKPIQLQPVTVFPNVLSVDIVSSHCMIKTAKAKATALGAKPSRSGNCDSTAACGEVPVVRSPSFAKRMRPRREP